MKGLGHAILCGENLIGDQPFAVLLADDLCDSPSKGVLSQMVDLYKNITVLLLLLKKFKRRYK